MNAKDQALLEFLRDFIRTNGFAPSYTEMMHGTGEKSKNGIHLSLGRLINSGLITQRPGISRSIQVCDVSTQG